MRHFWVSMRLRRVRARASSAGSASRQDLHAGQGRPVGGQETLVAGHALGARIQSGHRGTREDALREVGGQREAGLASGQDRAITRKHGDAPRAALTGRVANGNRDVQRVGEDLLRDATPGVLNRPP